MPIQILICPKCNLQATLHHIDNCNGDSVECDLCHLAVRNTYHSVYQHYNITHEGKFGKVRGKLKGQPSKPRGRYAKNNKPPRDEEIITIRLIIPYPSGAQTISFNKDYRTWVRLSKQPINVFNSKDQDELALMAAIETFKIEYLK